MMSDWISVEDRLPDDCDIVFFCTDRGGFGMGCLDGKECTVNYFPLQALGEIILWMPLPSPPELNHKGEKK